MCTNTQTHEKELIIYSHSNILPHSEITGYDSSTYETWEHASCTGRENGCGEFVQRKTLIGGAPCNGAHHKQTLIYGMKHFFLLLIRLDDFFFSTIKMWQCWRQGKCFHGNQRLLVEMLYSFDRLLRNFESTPCSIPFDVNLSSVKNIKKMNHYFFVGLIISPSFKAFYITAMQTALTQI